MLQSTTQAYLVVSAVIFGLVAIIHLVRALNNWAFAIGPITIPMSGSWIGFVITAALCLWAVRLLTT
jgi:hypothetical protein